MMKKNLLLLSILSVLLCLYACKSEFETVRANGSAEERLALANKYMEAEECYKAQVLYEGVIGAFRGLPEQQDIYYNYAKAHYCQGSYLSAAHYFNSFANTYPNSENKEEALFMQAYSYYQLSPDYKLDQTYTKKAITEFQTFVNSHPYSERVSECNRLIDECRRKLEKKTYGEGKLYYDMQQYEAATVSFKNLLRDFPESPNAEKVRYFIVKGGYNWAANSVLSKQLERYEMTVSDAEVFLARHDSSPYTKEVKDIKKTSLEVINKLQ